jgi:pimeloyl-ACP methyl ester carboxylesterase
MIDRRTFGRALGTGAAAATPAGPPGPADGERRYDRAEERLAVRPPIGAPAIALDAERDPFTAPGDGTSYRDRFTGAYDHRTPAGIGHNVPQEAPTAFAQAVADADHL